MTILEIIRTTEPVKMKLLLYAKDGNSVVRHYIQAHPVAGNLYIRQRPADSYGNYAYQVVAYFPCGYAALITTVSSWWESEETVLYSESLADDSKQIPILDALQRFGKDYASPEAFFAHLDQIVEQHTHLRALDLRLAEEMLASEPDQGKSSLLRYREYRERYLAESKERDRLRFQEYQQKEQEKAAQKAAEKKALLEETRKQLLEGGSKLKIDLGCLFDLAQQHNVPFALRLKGWMIKHLAYMTIRDGQLINYYYTGSHSTSIWKYMNALLQKIRQEAAEGKRRPEWILTDDSSGQHVQAVSDNEFHLIDTVCCGGDLYDVVVGSVVIDPQDLRKPDFIQSYMQPFGYGSYEDVVNQYGDSALRIIAECVFETDIYQHGDVAFTGSLQDCIKFITSFVKSAQ